MSSNLIVSKIIENHIFFVIPSWGNLLGYPILGNYANHDVSKITKDIVIFFGGTECSITTEKGILYYIFGLGYYYTRFELQSGRYITDNRQLTGLLLSDFVYDHFATSRNITLESDRDVIVNDNLFKLPIDLSHKTENKKTFIQGTLMRNLFIPYKDIILEFMKALQDPRSFQIETSEHMLLSANWDFYNKIVISDEMDYKKKINYIKPTAGLSDIIPGVNDLLNMHFSISQLKTIENNINRLKEVYSSIEYDPIYLFSIIDKASHSLGGGAPAISNQNDERVQFLKESVLISAEPHMNSFKDWPEEFKRQTKEQLEMSIIPEKTISHPPERDFKTEVPINGDFKKQEEKFELRSMTRPFVEIKTLPIIPIDNVLEILNVLKRVVKEDYDSQSIGKALEISRDNIKKIVFHISFLWDLSKYANIYQKTESNYGLSTKERNDLLHKIENWIITARKNIE